MRILALATLIGAIAAPAGATTMTIRGSVFASDLTVIDFPYFFPTYAYRPQYRFILTLSRAADHLEIINREHVIASYEQWGPGFYWSAGDEYAYYVTMAAANNTNVVSGLFTGASYRDEQGSNSRYQEWMDSRPVFAQLRFASDGVVDYAATLSGPVPEPANWAMMIAGFGLVGAALRRQRTCTKRFALP